MVWIGPNLHQNLDQIIATCSLKLLGESMDSASLILTKVAAQEINKPQPPLQAHKSPLSNTDLIAQTLCMHSNSI